MILGRLLVVAVLAAAAAAAESEPRLPAAEQEGVYAVLEAVNPGFPWRASFPDDLCLAGPHGVSCDDDDGGNASHVVGISLGYVSDFSVNPSSVAPSASASATLLTSGLLPPPSSTYTASSSTRGRSRRSSGGSLPRSRTSCSSTTPCSPAASPSLSPASRSSANAVAEGGAGWRVVVRMARSLRPAASSGGRDGRGGMCGSG